MPWTPEQRKAIAASYMRRKGSIPKRVRDELRGKPQKGKHSSRDRLAKRMAKRPKKRHRRRRHTK